MAEAINPVRRRARLFWLLTALVMMIACAVPFIDSNDTQADLEATAESLSATLTALPDERATEAAQKASAQTTQPAPDIAELDYDSLVSGLNAYGLENLDVGLDVKLRLESRSLREEDIDAIVAHFGGESILPPKRVPTALVDDFRNIRDALDTQPVERSPREVETAEATSLDDLAAQREALADMQKVLRRIVPVVSVEQALTPDGGMVEVMAVRDLFSGRQLVAAQNWWDGDTFLWVLAPEIEDHTQVLVHIDDEWSAASFAGLRSSKEANPGVYVAYLAEEQTWPEQFFFARGQQRHMVSEWSLQGLHLAVSFPHDDQDACVWWADLPAHDAGGNPLDTSDAAVRDYTDIALAPSSNERTAGQFAYVRGDVTLSDEPRLREMFETMLAYPPNARAFVVAFQEEMYITNRPEDYGAIGLGGNGIVSITPEVLNDYPAAFSGSVILHERVHSWQFETLVSNNQPLLFCDGRVDAEYEAYMVQQLALSAIPEMNEAALFIQDLIVNNTYRRGDDEVN